MDRYKLKQQFVPILLLFTYCFPIPHYSSMLDVDFYKESCPNVEELVLDVVQYASAIDPRVPAGLLRMHFHDCFVEGCDASVLLDSEGDDIVEKRGAPNLSLQGFSVIDDAKATIEEECPNTVSCADILAIAARDAVTLSGGPKWNVLKGRMDGMVSKEDDTRGLPSSRFGVSQMIQSFSLRNLSLLDMVTLSGAHTLGFSHCSSFNRRLYKFSDDNFIDPTLDAGFAEQLKSVCPLGKNEMNTAGVFLDDTGFKFDNNYYANLIEGKGVLTSDASLYFDPRTTEIVEQYACNQQAFFDQFSKSMVKMSTIGIKTEANGEIRTNCHIVNPPE